MKTQSLDLARIMKRGYNAAVVDGIVNFFNRQNGYEPQSSSRVFQDSNSLIEIINEMSGKGPGVGGFSPGVTQRMITNSDFAQGVIEAIRLYNIEALPLAETVVRRIAKAIFVQNFAPSTMARIALTRLEEQPSVQGSESRYGKMVSSGEAALVRTLSAIYEISREAIINNELDPYSLAVAITQSVLTTEDIKAQQLLEENPVMSDGIAVFHADHNNIGTPGAISDTTLTEAFEIFRGQTDNTGQQLYLKPGILLAPKSAEIASEAVFDKIRSDGDLYNCGIERIYSPYINGTDWYMFSKVNGLRRAYLVGSNQEPEISMKNLKNKDGVGIKARHDFGVAFADYQTVFYNAGA